MAAVHFLWSLSNDTPMLNHSTRICRSQGFCDNCCHSCHRVVADCVSMLNGLQEPLHPSCNRATLIVFESLITNSLKAQRFFNYFEKLKERWKKLMKHWAIREGENFFCLREIMFCEGVFVFREGVFCEGDGGVRRMAVLLQPVLCCQSIGWPPVARVTAVWVKKQVLTKFRCNNYRYLAIIPLRCHSDDRREEESRNHSLCVIEILR